MKPIVNMADVELADRGNGGSFAAALGRIGPLIGAEQLGCMLHVVPAGKKAFPRHAHHVNEEMMIILEGSGTWRSGTESWLIKAGDIIAAPAGDGDHAHQVDNTSDGDLRYLCVSTQADPEVVEYPDSNKFGVFSMQENAGGPSSARVRFLGRVEDSVDYYDGEE